MKKFPAAAAAWFGLVTLGLQAAEPPRRTTLSDPAVGYTVPGKPYVVLRRGPVRAVVVDNRAVDDSVLPGHKAGYHGLASLSHDRQRRSLFVPAYAGLNFEHIHDGTTQKREVLFEPRHAPMELRLIDAATVELYQPPTPHWGLESAMRYHLRSDGVIEMAFECIPRRAVFRNGYVGLFWASYIHQPESPDVFFRGRRRDGTGDVGWIRGASPVHGESAMHPGMGDDRSFAHDAAFPLTLVFNQSGYRYLDSWYFGVCRGMAFAQVFQPGDGVRFSQSPSGGGAGNAAWDFQWFIEAPEVGRRYGFDMRAVYAPFQESVEAGREALAAEVRQVAARAPEAPATGTAARIGAALRAVPAIDTHEHLPPFDQIRGRVMTEDGLGMTLHSLWQNSYYSWLNPLTPWPKSGRFDEWWAKARHDFDNARATSFYRYQLPAFLDLYGIDFDTITDAQARDLNHRIQANYRNDEWVRDVVTDRANIELMVMDPFWNRIGLELEYPFAVPAVNVTMLLKGFHPTEFASPNDSPYRFAVREGLRMDSLGDYLAVVERIIVSGKSNGAVCLKTTTAYERSLDFSDVPRERAEKAFGRPRGHLSAAEIKDFTDYMMWRIVEMSAKHDIPFQIHTGHARIQGSNPMLLMDLIVANPKTRFILFHGGYPWVGETGAIATRHKNVWIDSVWLPTISSTMARRAYMEWLDVVPSNRILWGADAHHAEGIYAATETTRRILAEALAEKVDRGELREEHALRIGRQILRENALELFPSMRARLWRDRPGSSR